MSSLSDRWRGWAKRLRTSVETLWCAARHPDTPRAVRWLALLLVAYAFSPVDLIPDFIPILGLVDDLLLIPLGIALLTRLVPETVWRDCRGRAADGDNRRKVGSWGLVLVVATWAGLAFLLWKALA